MKHLKQYLVLFPFLFSCFVMNGQESGMHFIENKGQWDQSVHYATELTFGNIIYHKNDFTFVLKDYSEFDHNHEHEENHHQHDHNTVPGHHFKIKFLGASNEVSFKSIGKSEDYYNYFLGNNPNSWASHVFKYQKITYQNLYDGIDLGVYGQGDNMKYEYYLQAGADPNQIVVAYEGLDDLMLDNGNLKYQTHVTEITELAPYAYQEIDGKRKRVNCKYVLDEQQNLVSYQLGKYDEDLPLVIDPTLIFSSFTGSFRDNFGFTATYDDNGLLYGGGMVRDVVNIGGDYPITPGAFDQTYNGLVDIGISAFNANGTALIYSTFIGGNNGDIPNSMVVNNNNELLVLATTSSFDFPMSLVSPAFDNTFNGGPNTFYGSGYGVNFTSGSDIAVFKLSADGTQLLGSTFFGGTANDGFNDDNDPSFPYIGNDLHYNYGDVFRGEITVDEFDNVYVASSTNSVDMPTTPGAADNTLNGIQDACVFRLNPTLSNLDWSTYFGGSNLDAGYSQKVDNAGNLVFCGGTSSTDLQVSATALNNVSFGGNADGYVAKLNGNTGAFISATYLGTTDYDQVFMVDVDDDDEVYVIGQSTGGYPIQTSGSSFPGSAQFIQKLSPDLSTSVFSTVFGNGVNAVNISPTAFQVDVCERIYVSGWGGLVNQGRNTGTAFTTGMPLTTDALKFESQTDGSDFYFIVFEKDLNGVLFGSYFGGGGPNNLVREHVDGGTSRFDKNAIIYQAVCAGCGGSSAFPTQPGVVSQLNNSANCNLGVIKLDIELPNTNVTLDAFPTATGCAPLTVQFESVLQNVSTFEWDFGDGNFSNLANPTHTYIDTGMYDVMLVGIDSNSCNIADTAFVSVIVDDDTLYAKFADSIVFNCDSNFISITGPTNYPTTQFFWDMGDNTTYNTQSINHTYSNPGNYTIQLVIEDTTSCELRDSTSFDVYFAPPFTASLTASDTFGCLPLTIDFANNHPTTDSVIWDFGDGSPLNFTNTPTHTFGMVDTFQVSLYVYDANTCNMWDTVTQEVIVFTDDINASIVTDPFFYECDSMLLNVYSTTPVVTNHFWDFDNGFTSSDSATTTFYPEGVYNGIYVATDTNLVCNPSDTVPFYVNLVEAIEVAIQLPDTLGCLPFTANFDGITNIPVTEYLWDFGTGDFDSIEDPSYTFQNLGTFEVTFIGINPLTCNGADTTSIFVTVIDDSVYAAINVTETLFECDSLVVQLAADYPSGNHVWDMGNGDTLLGQTGSYTYTNYGDYTIQYSVTDSSQICYPVDTASYPIHFQPVVADFTLSDTAGCIPLEVDFTNLSNGVSYEWDFEIGTSNAPQPNTVSYNAVDTFTVQLIAIDSTSCNLQDTAFAEIITRDDFVQAAFDATVLNDCDSLLSIELNNQSVDAINYTWDFQTNTSSAEEPGVIDYTLPGTYTITLIAENQNLCHPVDTAMQAFTLLPNVVASFDVSSNCETLIVPIVNNSNGTNYLWDFGDNMSSTEASPTHSYQADGFYVITLTAIDTNSCNFSDTTNQEVIIQPFPLAQFYTDTSYYIYPDPIQFINQSQEYEQFLWEFGDGITNNVDVNPLHSMEDIYELTTCLTAYNDFCADTFCNEFFIDFIELIGVPNAFSPNGDGTNDRIYVEGVGIDQLMFRIYNRWGELVFESSSQSKGWDGTYRGIPQEMEVYTYVVDATFINGTNTKLKGNITLLR